MMLNQPDISEAGLDEYVLNKDYAITSLGFRLLLKAGTKSDGASAPRIFWPIINPFELSIAGAFVHDELYGNDGRILNGLEGHENYGWFTRQEADDFLFDIAKQDGVWWWRRWIAYKMVRWFGASHWQHGTPPLVTTYVPKPSTAASETPAP